MSNSVNKTERATIAMGKVMSISKYTNTIDLGVLKFQHTDLFVLVQLKPDQTLSGKLNSDTLVHRRLPL